MVNKPYFPNTCKSASATRSGLPTVEYQLRVWHLYLKYAAGILAHKVAGGAAENASFWLELTPQQKVSPGAN